jgi:hypothetical protein
MRFPLRALLLPLLAIQAASLPLAAQSNAQIEGHPATQVVLSYLRYAMAQDWTKSVALLEPESVTDLRVRYLERIKQASTIDEEIAMVRKLNCNNLSEVEKMTDVDFYIAYHKGVQDRFEVTPEILEQIRKTMGVKLLSLGEETVEGKDYTHVLVRTKHQNRDREVSSLDMISLVKIDGKWKVTLLAQRPLVKKLEE